MFLSDTEKRRWTKSAYRHAGSMDLLTSRNDTFEWTVCHIQMIALYSGFMLLVPVPYSHIVLCLHNRASAWHCLSVVIHRRSRAQLWHFKRHQCGSLAWAFFFQKPLRYEEYLPASSGSMVLPENVLLFIFQPSANGDADTRGLLVSKGWQRSLCTWSAQARISLRSARTKTALCLSHYHHHQTHGAEAPQTACVLR